MTWRILFSPVAKRTRSALPRTALASETCFVNVGRFVGKSARAMRASEPLISAGPYGYWGLPSAVLPMDFGFGPEPRPLALAIRRSLRVAATTVGYHCVGMKPMPWSGWPEMSLARSKTATESEMALAEKRVFSSVLSARYSGSLPPYCCPGSFVERYETGSPVAV